MEALDGRHSYITQRLAKAFPGVTAEAAQQAVASFRQEVDTFFAPGGSTTLTWFYQVPAVLDGRPNAAPQLYVSTLETEPLRGKALSFSSVAGPRGVQERSVEIDVLVAEVGPQVLASLQALLADLYIPLVAGQQAVRRQAQSAKDDFVQGANKFVLALAEAAASGDAGGGAAELELPPAELLAGVVGHRGTAKSLTRAAADPELVARFTAVLSGWCGTVEAALAEGAAAGKDAEDAGPEADLDYWRRRMTRLHAAAEQLAGAEHRAVAAVCTAAGVPACVRWRELELRLADAAAEAKETVKYLNTLEGSLECIYTKPPAAIVDGLALIASNLRMVHGISRHYGQPAALAAFLRKVANQLIKRSRQHILAPGKLWEQTDRPALVEALNSACRLHSAFAEHASALLGGGAATLGGSTASAGARLGTAASAGSAASAAAAAAAGEAAAAALAKYGLFAKRCAKLSEMFSTVHQFAQLVQHTHIEGVAAVLAKFSEVVEDIKKRPYDLLDFSRTQFDRDLLEFSVQINDLEAALQDVIDASFAHSASTEQSLLLLRQFECLLQRDSYRADLDAKYVTAFQAYAADLEHVQRLYEKQKGSPPLARNAPPVAGAIAWARHLLHRIEAPMARFREREAVLAAKDSKRTIRTYNRLAQALIEFEALWHQAWLRGVDNAKAQLQATLLTEHPETGALLVNFDTEVLQLMREARYLQRLGLPIPDSAQMVLLQEEKFTLYYNQLSHALAELERLTAVVPTVLTPLLAPHLEDLRDKMAPGLLVLTWTSMNIDGYLHRFHQCLARTEELVRKVGDLQANRVAANLAAVSHARLLDLPADQTFTYEEFVSHQARHIKRQGEALAVRNAEVQRSCEELLDLVASWPRENAASVKLPADAANLFREHCARSMYQALLSAVKSSFSGLKRRLASTAVGGALFLERPVFGVDLQLRVPAVVLHPSLEEIQEAINATAKKVLQVAKQLRMWSAEDGEATYYDLLTQDPDIVKVVLLLTGSVEGMKAQTVEYLKTFQQYQFLWVADLAAEYEAFMARSPSLEECEVQLKRIMAVEQEISLISPVHNLGALSLDSQPLKYSLRAEAANWKVAFSRTIHKRAAQDLMAFDQYMRELTQRLGRRVEDLEDVKAVVNVLREVREYEACVDAVVGPIEDIYALLMRYEVRVPKEEADLVGDLRYSWRKLKKLSADVGDNLATLQVGFKRTLLQDVRLFVVDAVAFRQDWEANGPTVPGLDPMDATDRLRKFQQLFEVRRRKWDSYSSGEELFGLPVTQYPELERTEEEIVMLDKLYSLYVAVITTIRGWGDLLWVDVVEKIDAMSTQVNEFQTSCKKLPKALRDLAAYKDCRRTIDNFLALLPLFQALTHKSIRDRHWKDLQVITGKELNLAEDVFKLQHLLDADLLARRDDVEDLTNAAVKEEAIEVKLRGVAEQWAQEVFTFADHKQRGPVVLKPADTSELLERLEDSLMTLGSMATNRYAAPFRAEVQGWISKLSTVSETLEQWLMVQSMWQYMEAVFSGGDIVKQLPQEAKRFQNIDKNFMKVIQHASDTLNVVDTCVSTELLRSMLPHLLEQLEITQKSLSAYLEAKRSEFPRFYFVSDPTLLEILSLGSDPPSVVPHFQSGLFDSLSNVTFDKADRTRMLDMFSREGECVPLAAPVEARGNVEVWLQRLVEGMQNTMKGVIRKVASEVYEQELEPFLFGHPAQVALLGLQFQWTADMQAALHATKADKTALPRAAKKAEALLRQLVDLTLRTDLTRIQRTNLETCITVHMHQKEASEDLVKKKVKDPSDFEWLKQCRCAWRPDRDTVIVSICDVDFEYSYEYLGVKERLVITPLTDVCYITLSQALGMYLGGAPAGPAGTGKTETTKDLGATLGKYVVVFNCSDQMDYKGTGKIFKGLAQSGLWCSLDEFNRINLDVLSVCAQQIYCVLSAIREHKKTFLFTDGTTVPLDPRVGFFITMNPGYAGRQELPENLKALFRGVTMMVPNRQIIIKVKLAACGYQENDVLSKKFSVLYSLCEQQLSKQAHYDFGLRNILSVLRTAGASKRAHPDTSEAMLMMRTLRDMNMSKFVAEDVPLFLSLIDDMFPGLRAERSQFPEVMAALEKVVKERGLQAHPSWMNKCIQLYETYLVRHGIMVVGPAGSGKSSIIDCRAAALTELGTKHAVWRMNPKAITAPQMFGRMDAATGDWTDGIFAVLWRRAAKAKNQNTWIVLDGPVDAIWIESLNTVLDDNKVLTLANGDRVLMTPAMKAIFEPENLANASPATVSRAGIIYVSDSELGWQPVVASWLQARSEAEAAALCPCFDKYVTPLLDFIRLELRPVMSNEQVCQVSTLLTLLSGVLTPLGAAHLSPDHYERLFLYCATWSLGGLLEARDRPRFDAHLRALTDQAPEKVLESDTIYEFLVNEQTGRWQHWRERVPAWEYPRGIERPKFAQLVIPTLDSVRYEHLLGLVHSVGKATLLVGGPGTAKTSTIQQFLGRFSKEEHSSKTITFSYLTTPGIFQTSMEGVVEKRQGRTFGPPGGKSMTVFVDDISMPAINEWGDQVTNEIVRQLLEQQGFYSLDKPIGDMKYIVDTRFVAAMVTPGAGRSDIPNRLKRQFAIFHVPPPSETAIHNVFGTLMAGRFDEETFGAEVADMAAKLVPATMALWNRVQAKLLPTPAKFHYLFNMRDLSKVFQGVILAQRDRFAKPGAAGAPAARQPYGGSVTTPEGYLLGLWAHECARVFADKLVTQEDKAWVEAAVLELAKQTFGPAAAQHLAHPLLFVDYLREPKRDEATGEVVEARPSCYESVPGGMDEVRRRVEEFMSKFNEESRTLKMELVLFKDALEHVVRLSRLLAMERGSALLVGVGGSGKQSCARLAAYIAGAVPFQITITKTYNVTNLLEDIRGLYKIAGLKGQPVAFIFTDAEVKDEAFLEYINQLLMTGEIAGLFPKDELDVIVNDIRPAMRAECPGVPDTWDNLHNFFINRVRDRLHLVLCFSPVGKKFARWAQQFPGLINGCTIDWYLPWPEEALTAVSSKFLDAFPLECDPAVKQSLKQLMASVHVMVTAACQEYFEKYRRQAHVTPKSYLSFINGYRALYTKKLAYNHELAASINSGLTKMNDAKADISRMKGELAIKNQELAVATREAEKLLGEISESTAVAEKEKHKVAVIVEAVSKKAEEIAAVKEDAERDLAEAKPALDAALAALNSITPKDIGSLKALKNPPDVIKRIFDCVLLLRPLPVNKAAWQDVKGAMVLAGTYDEAVKMMGDMNFLQSLVNFPKEAINDETVELLQPYFAAPDFNYEAAKKASGNVAGLCNWAASMCKYHEVAKVVEPKIVALHESEAELKVATRERQAVEAELAIVQAKLDEMQTQFDAAMAQKQSLEEDAAATQRRMDAANTLISALGGEEVRWTAQSKLFDDTINRLIGDCAIASSFVSYLGPFNKEFRELLCARDFYGTCVKLGIPVTKDLQVTSFLADDTEIGEWSVEGLPSDDLSVQNGILVTRATRYPVLIDPQGQGRSWLMSREAKNGLKVSQLNDKHFRNVLEECLTFGKPLLIENIEEELDPVLDPVLEKRYIRKGKSALVQLADKEVDVSEGFALYCTTRLPNPKFTPELSAKVTVIDFTVTQAGLEDQLLGKLIRKEKSELESQREHLLAEVQSYKRKIKQLEDDLLFRLSNSQGNLLDDTELIDILAVTKQTAQEVNERLQTASETRRKINDACEEYRPVARRATLLYFLIAEFAGVNCMYQTSLSQFVELYEQSIDESERAALPAKRIHNILEHMTYEIYLYVQRGLFERHKLIFALMLAFKVQVAAGAVRPEGVEAFLKMGGALDIAAVRKKPKEWVPDPVWLNVVALSALDAFRDLPDSLARSEPAWRAWYDAEAPEALSVPDFEARLTKFERMCIVRALREDRTLIAAADFIVSALGQRFVESVPLNMERAWAESRPKAPLICLLSAGADPTKLIEDLAKKKKIRTLGVSMGQGQEVIARRLMATAAAEGCWVLLQNAHLELGYLAEVESMLAKAEGIHESFRLWITAEPHPAFPIGLLQMGAKITNEAPVGIKAGLRASYQWVTQEMLDACNRFEWRQLLFTTCFLHSVVQERRKFGPVGWCVPYDFSQGDLAAVTQFVQTHISDMDAKRAPQPDWATVRYMVAAIQYAGRITDDYDRVLMDTYAERFYHSEVLHKGAELHKGYAIPDGTEIEVFRNAIEELPANDSPELFGLHSNADLSYRRLQVQDAVELIINTAPRAGGGSSGQTREEVVDSMAEELLGKMPPLFEGEATKELLKKQQLLAPLTIHLRQEIDRLNKVIALVGGTLRDLRLAIAGTIALSDELAEALDALFNARVPKRWAKISWTASGSGGWFAGLLARHEQLHRWLNTGRPKAYWMSGFFNPQGFLTAVKQEVARRNKWALDSVILSSECTRFADEAAVKSPPDEGVYICGLSLEGAAWSMKEQKLVESEPKRLYAPLPIMHVSAVQASSKRTVGVHNAPLYRNKARTGLQYVSELSLKTDKPSSWWILRGVALLCAID
ncbi:flagellar outer dynein arm heavy chain gamma [Micractinium conductrix]|uniref:Flagellar outer dynein arm heavy chain gamma n=1 Tax=Micractinium conductrix TaxID=554055 RepID=A0A2P6VIM5_9CHLO|nr:flagellar outer dynein arm heavy chain gamma [Micractinium conductrix]|eukprot:PSC73956.1 flagellar outer dynein arm heavy chain gamma [Micractinium conductrix]